MDEATDISWCDGLFVGMLDSRELAKFDALCERGLARRSYEGAGGFLGLAKVRLAKPEPPLP